jgi:hypothetical protein
MNLPTSGLHWVASGGPFVREANKSENIRHQFRNARLESKLAKTKAALNPMDYAEVRIMPRFS